MALNPSNSSNLELLALKGLVCAYVYCLMHNIRQNFDKQRRSVSNIDYRPVYIHYNFQITDFNDGHVIANNMLLSRISL